MQSFGPLLQYLCSKCGSVLKETETNIEISTIVKDCPSCGAFLANSLRRRNKSELEFAASLPKFQTAYDLTRFKIDIERIAKFMPLTNVGSLCITGCNANLLLTRLIVRALLPANYGGLGSPYVIIVDAGNKSDFYQTVNFARQYGMNLKNTLDRIIINRTFTIYQLKSLLQYELPKVVQNHQASILVISGLLDLFEDPNIKKKEATRVIERIMKSINKNSQRLLVIVSVQQGKYYNLVSPSFEKRIILSDSKYSNLIADVCNQGKHTRVLLTQKDLSLIRPKLSSQVLHETPYSLAQM